LIVAKAALALNNINRIRKSAIIGIIACDGVKDLAVRNLQNLAQ
jgi:hypothetical protein